MKREEILNKCDEGVVILEPSYLDEAIVGVNNEGKLIYDYDRLVKANIEHGGMTYNEAVEWIEFNTIRSLPHMGRLHPEVMYKIED